MDQNDKFHIYKDLYKSNNTCNYSLPGNLVSHKDIHFYLAYNLLLILPPFLAEDPDPEPKLIPCDTHP